MKSIKSLDNNKLIRVVDWKSPQSFVRERHDWRTSIKVLGVVVSLTCSQVPTVMRRAVSTVPQWTITRIICATMKSGRVLSRKSSSLKDRPSHISSASGSNYDTTKAVGQNTVVAMLLHSARDTKVHRCTTHQLLSIRRKKQKKRKENAVSCNHVTNRAAQVYP